MQRPPNVPSRMPSGALSENTSSKPAALGRAQDQVGTFWDMLAVRLVFVAVCAGAGYHFRPFSLSKELATAAGLLFAILVILFEVRLRRASLRRLIGAATGSILGILGAYLTSLIFTHTTMPESTRFILQPGCFSRNGIHRARTRRQ